MTRLVMLPSGSLEPPSTSDAVAFAWQLVPAERVMSWQTAVGGWFETAPPMVVWSALPSVSARDPPAACVSIFRSMVAELSPGTNQPEVEPSSVESVRYVPKCRPDPGVPAGKDRPGYQARMIGLLAAMPLSPRLKLTGNW